MINIWQRVKQLFRSTKHIKREMRGQKECKHARTKDGLCPNWIEITDGGGVINHGIGECCAYRKQSAKMSHAIVYGQHNFSVTSNVIEQSKEHLRQYKEQYPDEYYEVFGIDECIGYSIRGGD